MTRIISGDKRKTTPRRYARSWKRIEGSDTLEPTKLSQLQNKCRLNYYMKKALTEKIAVSTPIIATKKHFAAFLYLRPLSITSFPKTHINKNSIRVNAFDKWLGQNALTQR